MKDQTRDSLETGQISSHPSQSSSGMVAIKNHHLDWKGLHAAPHTARSRTSHTDRATRPFRVASEDRRRGAAQLRRASRRRKHRRRERRWLRQRRRWRRRGRRRRSRTGCSWRRRRMTTTAWSHSTPPRWKSCAFAPPPPPPPPRARFPVRGGASFARALATAAHGWVGVRRCSNLFRGDTVILKVRLSLPCRD